MPRCLVEELSDMTAKKKVRTRCTVHTSKYVEYSNRPSNDPVHKITLPVNFIWYLPSASSSIDDLRLPLVKSHVIRCVLSAD